MKPLNEYIDHTLLKAEATSGEIIQLCKEAKEYGFYAVCVNSSYVPLAVAQLKGSGVKVAAVVGFPLGAMSTQAKAYETDWVCEQGALEVDMVLNLGALIDGRSQEVKDDISVVCQFAHEYDAKVKVILETCLLSQEQIVLACQLAEEAGADFVKTSTGFSKGGATEEVVALMKKTVGDNVMIKASGGIRNYKTAMGMIEAGADRLGASASVSIMKEAENK
ncbi:MAG: deoxyribose-phosphate aldolase [Anaerovoracaceae bacterium]|nr:deoxyribose-phosphate aldolase [Anaerovoracaceae bacterium]